MEDSMLIDSLIKFCNEKANNIKLKAEPQVFIEIAEALEELKNKDCSKCTRRSWYQKGYAKAIDEFVKRLKTDYVNFDLYYILQNNNFAFENTSLKSYQDMIDRIAEQMKVGGKNDN